MMLDKPMIRMTSSEKEFKKWEIYDEYEEEIIADIEEWIRNIAYERKVPTEDFLNFRLLNIPEEFTTKDENELDKLKIKMIYTELLENRKNQKSI
jgi:hypothetical protein